MKTIEDFFEKVEIADCWIWKGARNSGGYGQFWTDATTGPTAHRWLWEHLVGMVERGKQLDHLCRNRACVNPDHLEPVSAKENARRSESPAGKNARKARCRRGHPLSGQNLYTDPRGGRRCRECQREAERVYRTRLAAALATAA